MKNRMLALLLTLVIAVPVIAGAGDDKTKTQNTQGTQMESQNGDAAHEIAKSTEVISDFSRMKEGPPKGLVDKAAAVVIIPNLMKAAFMAGGKHGEGILTKRDASGKWSEPVFINLSGAVPTSAGVVTDLVPCAPAPSTRFSTANSLGGEASAGGPLAATPAPAPTCILMRRSTATAQQGHAAGLIMDRNSISTRARTRSSTATRSAPTLSSR
jgi:lipid-binding SYLF domain-containing protein